jgi:hypothetical protein
MVDGGLSGYTFAGIGHAEHQDRVNEHRTGVPGLGNGAVLLSAPINRTSGFSIANTGYLGAHLRLRNRGAEKTISAEPLTASNLGTGLFRGKLQYRSVKKGSVTITPVGGANVIVDVDSNGVADGNLYDTGTDTVRGTIDHENGLFNFTMSGTPTEMVAAAYKHTDAVDFISPSQAILQAGGAAFTFALAFGRVNPGSVAFSDSTGTPQDFVDDGKGNIIKTNAGAVAKAGTIDYKDGTITLTVATVGSITGSYRFNPFAAKVAAGGGSRAIDLFPGVLPELMAAAWAAGMKGQTDVCLWGESYGTNPLGSGMSTAVVAKVAHFGEDPFRVREEYSTFPAGGQSNDTRIL